MFKEEKGFKDEEGWIPWSMPSAGFISTAGAIPIAGTVEEMERAIEALQQMKNTWGEGSVFAEAISPPKPRVIANRSAATIGSITLQLIFPDPADRDTLASDTVFDIAYWDVKTKKIKKAIPEESIKRIAAVGADLVKGLKMEGLEANKSYVFFLTAQKEDADTNDLKTAIDSQNVVSSRKTWEHAALTTIGRPLKYPAVQPHWSAVKKSVGAGEVTLTWTRSAVRESQVQLGTRTYNIGIWDAGGERCVFAHDDDWNRLTCGIRFIGGSEGITGNTVTIKGLGSQRYVFGIQECAKAEKHSDEAECVVQSSVARVSVSLRTKKARYAAPIIKKDESAASQTFTITAVHPYKKPAGLIAAGYQIGQYDSALKTYIFNAASSQTFTIDGNQVSVFVQDNVLIIDPPIIGKKIKLALREFGTLPSGETVYSAKQIIKVK